MQKSWHRCPRVEALVTKQKTKHSHEKKKFPSLKDRVEPYWTSDSKHYTYKEKKIENENTQKGIIK